MCKASHHKDHTYSTYARGLDVLWGAYHWLDPRPRNATSQAIGGAANDEYDKR
jgi:predicted dithiol-disulfide oxidoreductase (DUF899 family)